MWRITAEGRRVLKRYAAACGGRRQFGILVGVGKNQVKPLLDEPDRSINHNTLRLLLDYCGEEEFREKEHYEAVDTGGDRVLTRLARDRDPEQNLNRYDQKGIELLYEALYKNPDFARLRPALDSPSEFRSWSKVWAGASADMPSEQFFVYRTFRDKVISFLFGERHLKTAENPLEVFAIWYLVGVSNAFYADSPVGLDADDERQLPLGERTVAASLTINLLEELRTLRSVHYLVFDIIAEELMRPDSYGRLLFQVYSHAEEDVRRHFSDDPGLRNLRCFVLDFPFLIPREGKEAQDFPLVEHRLLCCPLSPPLQEPFQQGAVPAEMVQEILSSVNQMFWDFYDVDSPKRAAIRVATERAEVLFAEEWLKSGRKVPCFTLRDYIKAGFGRIRSRTR